MRSRKGEKSVGEEREYKVSGIAPSPQAAGTADEASDRLLTIPNVISTIRLCLIPVFLVLLIQGHSIESALVFALASATDFLDGLIARSTHSVSKLGQILDPIVDRALIISVVIGIFLVGRLPLWMLIVIFGRDLYMLIGGGWLLFFHHIRVPVIFLGKLATTFLFVGFAGMLINMPLIPGLGVTALPWLPGFTAEPVSWGIWFLYAGIVLICFTTTYYTVKALSLYKLQLREKRDGKERQSSFAGGVEGNG